MLVGPCSLSCIRTGPSEGERRLRLASFLPSSQPDLRGHDREGSEEAGREGVKNPRLEEGTGRDWKKNDFIFLD